MFFGGEKVLYLHYGWSYTSDSSCSPTNTVLKCFKFYSRCDTVRSLNIVTSFLDAFVMKIVLKNHIRKKCIFLNQLLQGKYSLKCIQMSILHVSTDSLKQFS